PIRWIIPCAASCGCAARSWRRWRRGRRWSTASSSTTRSVSTSFRRSPERSLLRIGCRWSALSLNACRIQEDAWSLLLAIGCQPSRHVRERARSYGFILRIVIGRPLRRLGYLQPANHRGTGKEVFQYSFDVGEAFELHQFAGLVEADQVAYPGEGGDIGDAVLRAHDPVTVLQLPIQYAEQTLAFGDVAVAWALVFVILAGEFVEEAELAEHRADAADLEHQPLDGLVAFGWVPREQLAGFLRQINQDGAGLEQRQRFSARAVGIDDRRNLVVRVQREKFGGLLIVGLEIHPMRFVGQPDLLEHDRYLDAVGGGQRIQLQTLRVAGRPFAGDRESG